MTNNAAPRRSGMERWLMRLLAVLALIQIGAVIRSLRLPDELAGQVSLIVPLETAAAALWAGVFGYGAVALWRGARGALRRAVWTLFVFAGYTLLRLMVFARAEYDRQRLPLLAVLTILILLFSVAYYVYRTRSNAR